MFAKVFSQIFDSSIAESHEVRHIFMDLLVLADATGVVDMTIPAISRRINVPLESVRIAIEKLASPDPLSRSSKEGGRRIVLIDSHREWGWQIVNYEHYRKTQDEEARRSYFRDYRKAEREKASEKKKSCSTLFNRVQSCSTLFKNVTHEEGEGEGEGEAEGEAKAEEKESLPKTKKSKAADTDSFVKFWQAYPNRVGKGHARAAWAKNNCEAMIDKILETLDRAKASDAWTKDGGKWIPHPTTWLNREGWDDDYRAKPCSRPGEYPETFDLNKLVIKPDTTAPDERF